MKVLTLFADLYVVILWYKDMEDKNPILPVAFSFKLRQ